MVTAATVVVVAAAAPVSLELCFVVLYYVVHCCQVIRPNEGGLETFIYTHTHTHTHTHEKSHVSQLARWREKASDRALYDE